MLVSLCHYHSLSFSLSVYFFPSLVRLVNDILSSELLGQYQFQVPTLKLGEVVRVLGDAGRVQALQKRHGGWSSDMEEVKITNLIM